MIIHPDHRWVQRPGETEEACTDFLGCVMAVVGDYGMFLHRFLNCIVVHSKPSSLIERSHPDAQKQVINFKPSATAKSTTWGQVLGLR